MSAISCDFINASGSNVIVGNDANTNQIMDEKSKLERCNKLGAKILKARLQGKMVFFYYLCPLKIHCM